MILLDLDVDCRARHSSGSKNLTTQTAHFHTEQQSHVHWAVKVTLITWQPWLQSKHKPPAALLQRLQASNELRNYPPTYQPATHILTPPLGNLHETQGRTPLPQQPFVVVEIQPVHPSPQTTVLLPHGNFNSSIHTSHAFSFI